MQNVEITAFVSITAVVQLTDMYPLAQMLWTVLHPDQAHCCTGVQPASPCAVLPVVLWHRNKLCAPGFPYTM